MADSPELQAIRGKIAIDDRQKKQLAEICGVSRPNFSLMLRGDVQMPAHVMERLIKELDLRTCVRRLRESRGVVTGGN